jgi:hypothetical protein
MSAVKVIKTVQIDSAMDAHPEPFTQPQEMPDDLIISTDDDQESLAVLVDIVETGLAEVEQSYIPIGKALAQIRDRKLYRETHETFEKFVTFRFGLSRSSAYNYINAAGGNV